MDTGKWKRDNRKWTKDRDTRTWRPGEGHKDMTYGRGTLRHGHWERVTRTWLMKDGHCEMDNGRGTLGYRDWERDTKSWTLEGRH